MAIVATKCFFLILSSLALLVAADDPVERDPNSVKLSDIKVLTLRNASMTTGRRSSPIPQLKCVGGTAGCVFKPQTVQCYNRGSDGNDIQWECKTDMIKRYTFDKISVSCEGFDFPEDSYILRGSCALEYTIDLTSEGTQKSKAVADTKSSQSENKSNLDNDVRFNQTVATPDQIGMNNQQKDQKNQKKDGQEDDDDDDEEAGLGQMPWFVGIGGLVAVAGIGFGVYQKCIKPHLESGGQLSNLPNPFQPNPPNPGFNPGYPGNDPHPYPNAPAPAPAPGVYPQLPPLAPGFGGYGPSQPAGSWPSGPVAGGYNPPPASRNDDLPTVTYTSVPTHSDGPPSPSQGGGDDTEMRKASGFGGTTRR